MLINTHSSDFGAFADTIRLQKYAHTKKDGTKESWPETAHRVVTAVMSAIDAPQETIDILTQLVTDRVFIPGGRYLSSAGREYHQVQNCLLMSVEDSREGWSELLRNASTGLMTGAGIGVEYSLIREEGALIRRTGGTATGPLALMQMVNECGRGIRQGGSRRSAIWAGLNWQHKDIFKFITMKDWSEEIRSLKEKDFNFPATMDGTNISVGLDDEFFKAYKEKGHPKHQHAHEVYWQTVRHMLESAEPGFSVNLGEDSDEILRNACTEVSSADDSDICNLGSINMARISSLLEMEQAVQYGTLFLLAGTVYSDVPYDKVDTIRTKNRRLGLGLMGLHEWMLQRGLKYGPSDELEEYMRVYEKSTEIAKFYAWSLKISPPVKTRAIAPTGTIGIVAESSTGCEPLFCVAYKRRYLSEGTTWKYQYVIDPTAKRLIEAGAKPEDVEDAYSLAQEPERRVAFQAWLQKFVDHGISSTINLPAWGTEFNNESLVKPFGDMLMRYLPDLRGITCYPDGSRGGQPLTNVSYKTAMKHEGQIFVEAADICDISRGGSCGS